MFATLASDGSDLNLMFDLDQQEYFCKLAPHAFQALDNGWGRKGATRCDLKQANVNLLRAALETAHARANEPLKRPRATRARR
ncbi:MAG TPA: hypothetical protein VHM70_00785 [Polyangiaceae bacterium]|jgi:hypothetical protein|nr:hypothetical protein [Polyangiaceae bacterium]